MKKKLILICAFLLSVAMCFAACGTDTPPTDTDTGTVGSSKTETTVEETDEPAKKVSLKLTDGKNSLYRIVYSSSLGTDSRTAVKQFVLDMYSKTGAQIYTVADSTEKSSDIKEILVCETNRGVSVTTDSYSDYGIKISDDGTIAVYGYGNVAVGKALNTIFNATSKSSDGSYYYNGLSKIEAEWSSFISQLPMADFGMVDAVYQSQDYVYQVSIGKATKDNFNSYKTVLVSKGYTLHTENTIDSKNSFATYKNDQVAIHLSYHANISTVEIIIEKLGYLPAASAAGYTQKVSPTLTQMKLGADQGMSYVVQLKDGTFIIIDGGIDTASAKTELMAYLNEKNAGTGYDKPQVTWMFTHSHGDHIFLAKSFISEYSSQFDLNLVCWNFLDLDKPYADTMSDGTDPTSLMNTVKTKFPNAEIFTYHTGQVLYLAGCEIEFYLTHENVYPTSLETLNSASSVWKMKFDSGMTFMIFGDTTETSAELLNSMYTVSALRSIVMQAAHHGVTASAGTAQLIKLYASVDPSVVMWANPSSSKVAAFSGNYPLLNKSGLASIYSSETKSLAL